MEMKPNVFDKMRKRTTQGDPNHYRGPSERDAGTVDVDAVSSRDGVRSSSGMSFGTGCLSTPERTPPLVLLTPQDRSAHEDRYQRQFGYFPPSEYEFQTWLKDILRRRNYLRQIDIIESQ